MSDYGTKVWVVQRRERDGRPGEVLATKLTFGAAHAVAKANAPCSVHFTVADKKPMLVAMVLSEDRPLVKLISQG